MSCAQPGATNPATMQPPAVHADHDRPLGNQRNRPGLSRVCKLTNGHARAGRADAENALYRFRTRQWYPQKTSSISRARSSTLKGAPAGSSTKSGNCSKLHVSALCRNSGTIGAWISQRRIASQFSPLNHLCLRMSSAPPRRFPAKFVHGVTAPDWHQNPLRFH
jgi:hypothetical protein